MAIFIVAAKLTVVVLSVGTHTRTIYVQVNQEYTVQLLIDPIISGLSLKKKLMW
jgi:hypothetical protein